MYVDDDHRVRMVQMRRVNRGGEAQIETLRRTCLRYYQSCCVMRRIPPVHNKVTERYIFYYH